VKREKRNGCPKNASRKGLEPEEGAYSLQGKKKSDKGSQPLAGKC